MSNLLQIEVRQVKVRGADGSYNEISIYDDEESFEIHLGSDDAPTDPIELFKYVLAEAPPNDMIDFHINNKPGVAIEDAYYEWTNPGLAEILKEKIKTSENIIFPSPTVEELKAKIAKLPYKIGDNVIVPEPTEEDVWNHSFTGTVVEIFYCVEGGIPISGEILATVLDQEDVAWDVEVSRIKPIE